MYAIDTTPTTPANLIGPKDFIADLRFVGNYQQA